MFERGQAGREFADKALMLLPSELGEYREVLCCIRATSGIIELLTPNPKSNAKNQPEQRSGCAFFFSHASNEVPPGT
ncbi:MAG: hypothetical protein ACLQLH_16665 [Terracidiphilus sp.]|jgi:hypothetical protein